MMKYFGLLFFLCSLMCRAQNIEINKVDEYSATASINGKSLSAFYRNKDFDLETENLIFKDLKVFNKEFNNQEIARYGVDKLIDSSGVSYSFKIDKKNKKVIVSDKSRNIILVADLIFDSEKAEILRQINITKKSNPSELLGPWITLASLNRLYGHKNNEILKELFKSFVFGSAVGVVHGVITK